MILPTDSARPLGLWTRFRRGQRRKRNAGSAMVIVLILLGVMTALVISNSVTLRRLKVGLQVLEQQQQRVLEQRAPPAPPAPGGGEVPAAPTLP